MFKSIFLTFALCALAQAQDPLNVQGSVSPGGIINQCVPPQLPGLPRPPVADPGEVCDADLGCGSSVKNPLPVYIATTTATSYALKETTVTVPIVSTTVSAVIKPVVTKRVGQCIVDEPVDGGTKIEVVWVEVTSTKAVYSTSYATSTTEIYVGVDENVPCTSTPAVGNPQAARTPKAQATPAAKKANI